MFTKLLVLFTTIPVLELFLLVTVGRRIGTMNTVALVVITGVLGAWFAKSQGLRVIYGIGAARDQGQIPGQQLLHGAMVLVGGVLLITPGFITDVFGLSLLFPITRNYYVRYALVYIKRKLENGQWKISPHY